MIYIHLHLANLLVAHMFILGHDAQKEPYQWLWELAENTKLFSQFSWGAYSFKTLKYYLENVADNNAYHFYGPTWALYVWDLEVVPGLAEEAGVRGEEDWLPRGLN